MAASKTAGRKSKALAAKMSGLQAFRRLIEQGAATHDAQIEPILTSDDPEAVHRARVALRRMRSTVRGFADMLSPNAGGQLESALADRFRALGPLRDADVHAGELAGSPAGDEAARQAAELRKALRAEMKGKAWMPLSDEVARLLDSAKMTGGGRRRRLAEASVRVIASRALQVAWTEMLAFGDHLDRLSEDDLHDFRKRAKDMRYLSEFFGPLWPGKPEAEMVRRMAKMQDALGTLNDLTNMRRNAQEGPEEHWLPADASKREAKAREQADKAWARLRKVAPWWCAPQD